MDSLMSVKYLGSMSGSDPAAVSPQSLSISCLTVTAEEIYTPSRKCQVKMPLTLYSILGSKIKTQKNLIIWGKPPLANHFFTEPKVRLPLPALWTPP